MTLTPAEAWVNHYTDYIVRGDDKILIRLDGQFFTGPATDAEMKFFALLVKAYEHSDVRLASSTVLKVQV